MALKREKDSILSESPISTSIISGHNGSPSDTVNFLQFENARNVLPRSTECAIQTVPNVMDSNIKINHGVWEQPSKFFIENNERKEAQLQNLPSVNQLQNLPLEKQGISECSLPVHEVFYLKILEKFERQEESIKQLLEMTKRQEGIIQKLVEQMARLQSSKHENTKNTEKNKRNMEGLILAQQNAHQATIEKQRHLGAKDVGAGSKDPNRNATKRDLVRGQTEYGNGSSSSDSELNSEELDEEKLLKAINLNLIPGYNLSSNHLSLDTMEYLKNLQHK